MDCDGQDPSKQNLGVRILISFYHVPGPSRPRTYTSVVQKKMRIADCLCSEGDADQTLRSDGVHLTKEGYELMGDTIANRLIGIIKPPGVLEPNVFRTFAMADITVRPRI
jgi:hypothetical protein